MHRTSWNLVYAICGVPLQDCRLNMYQPVRKNVGQVMILTHSYIYSETHVHVSSLFMHANWFFLAPSVVVAQVYFTSIYIIRFQLRGTLYYILLTLVQLYIVHCLLAIKNVNYRKHCQSDQNIQKVHFNVFILYKSVFIAIRLVEHAPSIQLAFYGFITLCSGNMPIDHLYETIVRNKC